LFHGDSERHPWELDALDPVEMVRLVKAEILSRIDTDAWERVEEQEEEDDSALENFQPFLEALRSRPSGVVKRCPVV
jgi:hypothetical protein